MTVGFIAKLIRDGYGTSVNRRYYDDGSGELADVVRVSGGSVAEAQTEADAVDGVLTFAADIHAVRILNTDAANDGVFTVNGIALLVPKGTGLETGVSGTPGATVTVTGATTYAVQRLV